MQDSRGIETSALGRAAPSDYSQTIKNLELSLREGLESEGFNLKISMDSENNPIFEITGGEFGSKALDWKPSKEDINSAQTKDGLDALVKKTNLNIQTSISALQSLNQSSEQFSSIDLDTSEGRISDFKATLASDSSILCGKVDYNQIGKTSLRYLKAIGKSASDMTSNASALLSRFSSSYETLKNSLLSETEVAKQSNPLEALKETTVAKPSFLRRAASSLWKKVIAPVGRGVYNKVLKPIGKFTYNYALKPIGYGLKGLFYDLPKATYKHVLKPVGKFIYKYGLKPLAKGATLLAIGTGLFLKGLLWDLPKATYKHVLKPVGKFTYNYTLKPIGKGIGYGLKGVFYDFPKFIYEKALAPAGRKVMEKYNELEKFIDKKKTPEPSIEETFTN